MEENAETIVDYFDNKAIISPDGVYALYKIRLQRGQTPAELLGSYTSEEEAIKAIRARLSKGKRANGS